MEELIKYYQLISARLIENENLSDSWIDEKLALRESEPFDGNWINSCNEVNPEIIEPEHRAFIESARKEIFMKAIKLTNSSDMAALISDDFELLLAAKAKEIDNEFLGTLATAYAAGIFPPK